MTSSQSDRIEATRAKLEAAARASGWPVTHDGRVGENHAAQLIGFKSGTWAKKRAAGQTPRHYPLACGGSRFSYRLADLAAYVESCARD